MDNLTHTLVGLVAAKAGLERVSPGATAVCLVAANAPDADIAALAGGRWFYLQHHRGITHSIVGTLALALLVPLLFFACERLYARVRGRRPKVRLGGLVLASLAVSATHPLMDWTNNYGLRPFLPWSGDWYYGDLVFIVDPLLWLALGGAAFLATARSRRAYLFAWAAFGLLLTAAMLLLPPRMGMGHNAITQFVWPAGVLAFAAAHAFGLAAGRARTVAASALAFVVLYWGALWIAHARALGESEETARAVATRGGETVRRVAAMPTFADPTGWVFVSETDAAFYRGRLDLRGRAESQGGPAPDAPERFEKPGPEAAEWLRRREREDYAARVFLGFARFAAARFEGDCTAPDGRAVLKLADLRFTEPGGRRGGGGFALELPAPCRP